MSFENNAHRYNNSLVHQSKTTARIIINFLKKRYSSPIKIIDLGCGAGHFSKQIASTNDSVILLDKLENMLAIARNNLSQIKLNRLETINVDLDHLTAIPKGDLYITRMALHHVDYKKLLKNISQLIPVGSVVVIADLYVVSEIYETYQAISRLHDPSHLDLVNIEEIKKIDRFKILNYEYDYSEYSKGISIKEWCLFQNRSDHIVKKIKNILRTLSSEQLTQLGFYKNHENEYLNTVKQQLIILKRI